MTNMASKVVAGKLSLGRPDSGDWGSAAGPVLERRVGRTRSGLQLASADLPAGLGADGFERPRERASSVFAKLDGASGSWANWPGARPRFILSPSAREIADTVTSMRDELEALPEGVRAALEREVFEPVRRLLVLIGAPSADEDVSYRDPRSEAAEATEGRAGEGRILVAGGWETELVEVFAGGLVEGALFTSRGPSEESQGIEYKPYNEDGALLGEIPRSGGRAAVAYAGVADQAGGMGQLHDAEGGVWVGGASAIVLAALAAAAEEVHQGTDPEAALRAAVRAAHHEILANNPQAGTTIAGALVVGHDAHVVTLGDSEVWHYGADGTLKNRAETDSVEDRLVRASLAAIEEEMEADGVELSEDERASMERSAVNAGLPVAHVLDACVGGSSSAEPHYAVWPLSRGDFLVFGSDGLADANLQAQKKAVVAGEPWSMHHSVITAEHLGEILGGVGDAASAANALTRYALDQMAIRDRSAYRRALVTYCKAEDALEALADAAPLGRGSPKAQRAFARAQGKLSQAAAELELLGGDGKPDNVAIVVMRVL